jgi:hypothetical protein
LEPRITRLRQRLTAREAQAQQIQDEAALQTEWQMIIGRLEDFAAQGHGGLADADWTSKRELIRAFVKRVAVTHSAVNVVFRVDQRPTDPAPAKKSLQLRRWSAYPSSRKSLPRSPCAEETHGKRPSMPTGRFSLLAAPIAMAESDTQCPRTYHPHVQQRCHRICGMRNLRGYR